MQVRGKVAKKFGDDINTDYIIPAYLLQESWDKQFFADHTFEDYDPSFKTACRAAKESIVVASNNFGCGSSRSRRSTPSGTTTSSPSVAQSFPDIFYRNSLNNGLLPIQVADTSAIQVGDELLLDLDSRALRNLTRGEEHRIIASDAAIEQMKRGGFLGYVRERLRQKLRKHRTRDTWNSQAN